MRRLMRFFSSPATLRSTLVGLLGTLPLAAASGLARADTPPGLAAVSSQPPAPAPAPVQTLPGAAAVPADARREAAREQILAVVARAASGLPGRVEIEVGNPDARLAGAPCAQPEAYLPTGARLGARLYAGLRCANEPRWSLLVPVTLRQFGPSLQARQPLAAGSSLDGADVSVGETDWLREAPGMLAGPEDVAGQVLVRALPAGTVLRREHFRAPLVAQAGDPVTLRYSGAGFVISASGKVLQPASEGQRVRVQADGGRILTGVARGGRVIEVGDAR